MGAIKAVIFDVYGTLISTGTGSRDAAAEILRRNGREDISPARFYSRWKALHRTHIDGLAGFETEEAIFRMDLRRLYDEYGLARDPGEDVRVMLDTLGRRRAFPEAPGVWAALSGRYRLAIGSTSDTAPLLADLARAGLSTPYLYTSESLRVYKPQAAFYQAILRGLGLAASEALFVGDSLADDVAGPQGVGLRACWVDRRDLPLPEGAAVPDYTIADLTGLEKILEEDGGSDESST